MRSLEAFVKKGLHFAVKPRLCVALQKKRKRKKKKGEERETYPSIFAFLELLSQLPLLTHIITEEIIIGRSMNY